MAQKDYVSRGRSSATRRKKNSGWRSGKRRGGVPGASAFMVALAAAVLVTFAGGLWFIAHHKNNEEEAVIRHHKNNDNSLPPKPEERWRYIKELENRQVTIPVPTEPSMNGGIHPQMPLTDEQRQLLAQIQADMKQQPVQLNEVPWNEQTPLQRQQTLQRQQQLQMQSRLPQTPEPMPVQVPAQNQTTPPPKTTSKAQEPEKTQSQRWMVQCGSFKKSDQAESIRVQLAFEGFESQTTAGGGWNRVMIGPYNNRAGMDSTLKRLRSAGHTNCIPVAIGG